MGGIPQTESPPRLANWIHCLPAVLLAAVAAPAAGQEGPLANDTFLPVNERAAEAFARGDALYAARAGDPEGPDGQRLPQAFDAWREALLLSATGDAVPPPSEGNDRSPRHSIGVEEALLLRIGGLPQAERARYAGRFADLARRALARARSALGDARIGRLAALEREFPATVPAALAALALADHALEAGRTVSASTWLARASRHRHLSQGTALTGQGTGKAGGTSADLAPAIERRRGLLDALLPRPATEAWTSMDRLQHVGSRALRTSRTRGIPSLSIRENVQPGLAILADGTLLAQGRERAYVFPPRRQGFAFQPWQTVYRADHPVPPETGSAATGRWPLYPLAINSPADIARGEQPRFLLVVGRSASMGDNALLAMELSPTSPISRTLWTFNGSGGSTKRINTRAADLVLGPGRWEWEPGPVLSDDTVLVQARQAASGGASDSLNVWLIALARNTGEVLWQSFLAKGAPLRGGNRSVAPGSVRAWSTPAPPGQPLVAVAGAVFCGTNLGAGALVDAADGRLRWTLKNRRAGTLAEGWTCAAPPPVVDRGRQRVIVWTPADSDHLYELQAPSTRIAGDDADAPVHGGDPLAAARALPLASPPRPRGEASELLGASGGRMLFLGRSGARLTLTLWDEGGRRADSLYLGRDESFTGSGLASPLRALFATNRGLYLFDTSFDPSLIELLPLDSLRDEDLALAATGGAIFASGTRVWVLAPGRLDEFHVRNDDG